MSFLDLIRSLISYGDIAKNELEEIFLNICKDNLELYEIAKLILDSDLIDPSINDNIAICSAVNRGHSNIVKMLLGCNKVDPTIDDNYPIRRACYGGNEIMFDILMQDSRIDPSAENNFAIRICCCRGYYNIVSKLLKDYRVDPSVQSNNPIRSASQNNHSNIVRLLLTNSKVDPTACDNFPIRKAVQMNSISTVKLLLKDKRVDPGEDDDYCIRCAIYNNNTEIVKSLLKSPKVNAGADNNFAIRYSVYHGNIENVIVLLDNDNVDPTCNNNTAIKCAIYNNHTSMVKLLFFDKRVDITIDDNCVAEYFIRFKQFYHLTLLLNDSRIDKDSANKILLHALKLNSKAIKIIVEHPKTNFTTGGNHLIKHAIQRKYTQSLKYLFNNNKFTTNDFKAIFMYTINYKLPEIMRLMLNLFKSDCIFDDDTIIDYIIEQNFYDAMKEILSDSRIPFEKVFSILYKAVEAGDLTLLTIILKNYYSSNILNNNHLIIFAIQKNDMKVVKKLIQHNSMTLESLHLALHYSQSHSSAATKIIKKSIGFVMRRTYPDDSL